MGATTRILWADSTWNPVSGCSKVSPGCDNCYAEVIAERFRGGKAWPNGFDVQLRPGRLEQPLTWRKGRRIFVNSMSDVFHREIPDDYLLDVWRVMLQADQHIYQILTKRPHRAAYLIDKLELPLPRNIWIGTSVENQKFADNRLTALAGIRAHVRFVSCEPLLGPVTLARYLKWRDLDQVPMAARDRFMPTLDWVITGAESGPARRRPAIQWFRDLRDESRAAGVAFFHKQGSAAGPDRNRVLDGKIYSEFPDVIHTGQGVLL